MKRPDKVARAAIDYLTGDGFSSGALRAALEEAYPGALSRAKAARAKAAVDAKFIGDVPAWARRYVLKHGPRVDTLRVRWSRVQTSSSGYCNGRDIVVTFARSGNEDEQRQTVLHEIAHSIKPLDGHGDKFYAEWRRLLASEGQLRKATTSGRFGPRRGAKLRRAALRTR